MSSNLTAGSRASLPAGVDDPAANEFHPALSPNGRYLVFQRVAAAGTVRILMVDRTTGQSADLFSAFEAAADPPNTPTFSPDGTKVLTGRGLDRRDPGSPPDALQSSVTETDVTNFPTGPFPHRVVLAGGPDSTATGRTLQAAPFGSSLLAFGIEFTRGTTTGRITVQGTSGATTLSDPTGRFADPAISQTDLPELVNAPGTIVSNPAFTPDGRYLAFRRGDALFVWDTQTQLLVVNGIRFVTPDLRAATADAGGSRSTDGRLGTVATW